MSVCEAAGERLAPRVGRPFSLPSIIKVSGHTESSEGVEGQETRGPTGLSWASLSLTYTYIHTHSHTHTFIYSNRPLPPDAQHTGGQLMEKVVEDTLDI